MLNAETIIKTLKLKQHPEGGWYRETYRASETIKKEYLPERFTGDRNFSTAIYFLLMENDFSAFHRIKQDEIWHFYYGDSIIIHTLDKTGKYSRIILGSDITKGESMQSVIYAGTYFAAEINSSTYHFSLAGCTVAPGFDFEDFEMPERKALSEEYPVYTDIIRRLTML